MRSSRRSTQMYCATIQARCAMSHAVKCSPLRLSEAWASARASRLRSSSDLTRSRDPMFLGTMWGGTPVWTSMGAGTIGASETWARSSDYNVPAWVQDSVAGPSRSRQGPFDGTARLARRASGVAAPGPHSSVAAARSRGVVRCRRSPCRRCMSRLPSPSHVALSPAPDIPHKPQRPIRSVTRGRAFNPHFHELAWLRSVTGNA